MKKQDDSNTISGEKLIYVLESQIQQQDKIIALQEETIQILNQQNNELTEMLSSIIHSQ